VADQLPIHVLPHCHATTAPKPQSGRNSPKVFINCSGRDAAASYVRRRHEILLAVFLFVGEVEPTNNPRMMPTSFSQRAR
jgi:hypothetical protein